jgi:hypothetical protein
MDAVTAQMTTWKVEREKQAAALAELDATLQAGETFSRKIDTALKQLQDLQQLFADNRAGEVREVIRCLAKKITLHFDHPKKMGGGKTRTVLESVEFEFCDEASHLLGIP